MSPRSPSYCSACATPATTRCGNCDSISYCSRDCQKKDWPSHKVTCKKIRRGLLGNSGTVDDINLERVVRRAADIVQKAYFGFRENTFDAPIAKVQDQDGCLKIFEGTQMDLRYFVKFPNHLVQNESAKAGVLCALMCNEPLAYMRKTVALLFEGCKVQIEELNVSMKKPPRKTMIIPLEGQPRVNWPYYSHEVIRVTSEASGAQWAIDISGAQYGLSTSCWDWKEYEEKYIEKINMIYKFGTNEKVLNDLENIQGHPDLTYGIARVAADQFNKAVGAWVLCTGSGLSEMVLLDDQHYLELKNSFLRATDASMSKFVAEADFSKRMMKALLYEFANPSISQMALGDLKSRFERLSM